MQFSDDHSASLKSIVSYKFQIKTELNLEYIQFEIPSGASYFYIHAFSDCPQETRLLGKISFPLETLFQTTNVAFDITFPLFSDYVKIGEIAATIYRGIRSILVPKNRP